MLDAFDPDDVPGTIARLAPATDWPGMRYVLTVPAVRAAVYARLDELVELVLQRAAPRAGADRCA